MVISLDRQRRLFCQVFWAFWQTEQKMTGEKHSKRQEGKKQKILMQSHAQRLPLCSCTSPLCHPGLQEFTLLFVSPEACTPGWRCHDS